MLKAMFKNGQKGPGGVVRLPSDPPDKVHQLGALLTVHQTSFNERLGLVLAGLFLIGVSLALFACMAAVQRFNGKAVIMIIVLPILGCAAIVRGLWNMARRLEPTQATVFCVRLYDCTFPERGVFFIELWYDGVWVVDQRLELT